MSLTPVIYVDNETVIGAQNLNAIQDAILANEQGLANKVNTSDYNPSAKTSEMTQEVGKDTNGKLWTNPSGGAGLVIKGYYPTLQALIAAVPNPSLGDTYGVGSAAPYEIYMWDGTTWVDNGTIKGEKGDDGEDGEDGFSPIVSSEPITGGTRVSIEDATHTETFDVMNGTGSGDMQASVYDPQGTVSAAGGIPEYVNANGGKIDHIQLNGTEQAITNKTVNLTPSATDVAYGQSNVGAELTAQSSQIVLLNTTVGDSSSGLVKDVADLEIDKMDNWDLVYTNPSPSSPMGATTIPIDLSSYGSVALIFILHVTVPTMACPTVIINVGKSGVAMCPSGTSGATLGDLYLYGRVINSVSTTGISLATNYVSRSGGNWSENTVGLILYKVYGIKGVV